MLSTGKNIRALPIAPPRGEGRAIICSFAVIPKQPSMSALDGDLTSSYLNYDEAHDAGMSGAYR